MRSPLVSIVIPTFNRADVICTTLDNVLQQTYSNTEIIVVDDGSVDDTQSRLRKYHDRIRVVSQANAGPAAARNRGVAVSKGEIIAFQDSDDLWKPTKVERQVALLDRVDESVPCCLCSTAMRIVDGRPVTSFDISLISPPYEESIWLNPVEILATRFVLFNQAVAIRRKAWNRLGGFDESLRYLEDYDLPLRLAFDGPWALINEALVIYREGSRDSFSNRAHCDEIALKECELRIFQRALERVSQGEGDLQLRKHFERRLRAFRHALRAIELREKGFWWSGAAGGMLSTALRYYESALRRSPWYPKVKSVRVDQHSPRASLRALNAETRLS